jgi:hypothetical protein
MAQLFNDRQKAFIRANAKGLSNQDLTDLLNEEFGLSITRQQVKAFKHRHKISSGLTGRFEKGHAPPNKGTKGLYNVGGNKTSFQKGQKPLNYRAIGSERVNVDGYTEVKVADPGKWRLKHTLIWEQAHGPIPKGRCLIFLDGDNLNVTLENLQLITRTQLLRLNQNDLISNNPELTKSGLIVADIITKISERKRK